MPETMTFPLTRQGVRDLDRIKRPVLPVSGGPAPSPHACVNVGPTERFLSTIGGGAAALFGLTRGTLAGFSLALAGGALLYRGLTGHCHIYEAVGMNTSGQPDPASRAEVVYRPR
jgi:uncharacterized membrane protein